MEVPFPMGDKILKKALQEIINYYQSQGMAGKLVSGNTRQFLLLICKRALRIHKTFRLQPGRCYRQYRAAFG